MARLGFALTLLAVACAAATAAAGAEGPAAGAAAASPAAGDDSAAVTKAVQICSTCHGPYGVSVSPEFPNLAGQHESYLIAQLHAFQHHTRAEKLAHDFMWGMAGLLDEETIKGLAKY
jgi:cytochrome c553